MKVILVDGPWAGRIIEVEQLPASIAGPDRGTYLTKFDEIDAEGRFVARWVETNQP